jgi:hypothetical protein
MSEQTVNLGNPTGEVGPGDLVICGGMTTPVLRVVIHGPNTHSDSIIGDTFHAVEVITGRGSRWLGGTSARINSGLRVEWSR